MFVTSRFAGVALPSTQPVTRMKQFGGFTEAPQVSHWTLVRLDIGFTLVVWDCAAPDTILDVVEMSRPSKVPIVDASSNVAVMRYFKVVGWTPSMANLTGVRVEVDYPAIDRLAAVSSIRQSVRPDNAVVGLSC